MAENQHPGLINWIDHCVVGTNDMNRWLDWAVSTLGVTLRPIFGLTTNLRKRNVPINCFVDIKRGACHLGAFLQLESLPPSAGVGKEMPRYGLFVRPEEIKEHMSRLDRLGVPHTDPLRTAAEGDEGTAIYFEDPDGNQFEFWAPVHMPDGAMEASTPLKVGRVSSAVFGTRDLKKAAGFFSHFYGLEQLSTPDMIEDTVALGLAGGARIVYKLVEQADRRTAGHHPWFALHAALTVPEQEFFPLYQRMWGELSEWESTDHNQGLTVEEEDLLPARTGLHESPVGRKWKAMYGRGDEFFDSDTHAFHLVGGVSARSDGSLALYEAKEPDAYLQELAEASGKDLASVTPIPVGGTKT